MTGASVQSLLFVVSIALCGDVAASSNSGAMPSKPARLGLCEACHGADGQSRAAGTPHLTGQDETYLREALAQYRDGRRAHAPMRAIIQAVPEPELSALAAWYSAQPVVRMESEE